MTGALMLRLIVFEDGIAVRDTLVTNVGFRMIARRRDKLPYDFLTFVTERTSQRFIRSVSFHPELLRPTSRLRTPITTPQYRC
jgi:hypothetical protein